MPTIHDPSVTIECRQGLLSGTRVDGVDAFFDIPYAADLGAKRRFSLPEPPAAWTGVRDASHPGPVFPQTPSRLTAVMGTTPEFNHQSEDAFRLNIWAPSRREAKLPVLVWIHGGGWLTGGAPLAWYHGDNLARSGRAIVVSVNYRLGALGNLYLPGQTTGSMALHDLRQALFWINSNIAAFGGDASRITLCGQSAGAWYTAALSAWSESSDLFAQAILLSVPGSITPQSPDDAAALAGHYCRLLGVSANIEALRQLPLEKLLEGQALLARATPVFADIPETFLPLQSDSLPADMIAAAAARSFRKPLLIGSLPDEMGVFFSHDKAVLDATHADASRRFETVLGAEGAAVYAGWRREHPDVGAYEHLLQFVSDQIFRKPTARLADTLVSLGGRCYMYEFAWRSKADRVGACHCLELPFLFDNFEDWSDAAMLRDLDLTGARAVAQAFQAAVLNFVERGDPNGEGLPDWPSYSRGSRQAVIFDTVLRVDSFYVRN
ncbi:carboxylesterase/lipase family protein [Paraburkholderia sp. ZP32-5]|uniref:carboxylesterase/lipase family protein n=1 Tax=Paraburkholderia sp. ZP32-5 TaxID=2883245 RepID=UPI001F30A24D|nr:carboxylesterase family protein [Paraburkholderia sp. ZP32-5]